MTPATGSGWAYACVAGTVALTVYGQLVIKWRVASKGHLPELLSHKLSFVMSLLIDPFIVSGYLAAFAASLLWIAAITNIQK